MKKVCFIILFTTLLYSHATSAPQPSRYNPSFNVQARFKKTSFIAKVNGYDIAYDLYYPDKNNEDSADSVVLYAKKGKKKNILLSMPLDGFYLGEVLVKNYLNHTFIYIATDNFHGDTYGEIYLLNISQLQMEQIDELPSPFKAKAPKGYYQNKHYGIRIEENNRIFDGIIYRNDDNGDLNYKIDIEYKMVKIGRHFKLKPIKQLVSNHN